MENYIERDVYVKNMVSVPTVRYVQDAYGIGIKFNFRDYEIPEEATARFGVLKPSGLAAEQLAEAHSEAGNYYVLAEITEQMTVEAGICKAQINLSHDGVNVFSFPITFEVISSPFEEISEMPESKNDLRELLEALNKSNAATQESIRATSESKTATEQSKAATDAAKSATELTKTATQNANAATEAANTAKANADTATANANAATEKANAAAKNADDKRTQFEKEQAKNNENQEKNNADQLANNLAAQGIYLDVLKAGEYDETSGKPTVEGASGIIYGVPAKDFEERYQLWLWDAESQDFITAPSSGDLSNIFRKKADKIQTADIADGAVTTTQILDGTITIDDLAAAVVKRITDLETKQASMQTALDSVGPVFDTTDGVLPPKTYGNQKLPSLAQALEYVTLSESVLCPGQALVPDPIFTQSNAIVINAINGRHGGQLELVSPSEDNPYKNQTTHELLIKKPDVWTVNYVYGFGMYQIESRPNCVYLVRVCAKIPEQSVLTWYGNNHGTGGRAARRPLGIYVHNPYREHEVGSGYFKDYYFVTWGGIDGNFSSNGFPEAGSLMSEDLSCDEWRVAMVQIYDITALPGGAGDLATSYRAGLISPAEKQWLAQQMGV